MSSSSKNPYFKGNEKYVSKLKEIQLLIEEINETFSIEDPSQIEEFQKNITPLLVKNILNMVTLYINKFDIIDKGILNNSLSIPQNNFISFYQIEILIEQIVNYMVYNQIARVKYHEQSCFIYEKLFIIAPNQLFSSFLQIVSSNKLVFILNVFDKIKHLISRKKFSSFRKIFQKLLVELIPRLFKYIYKSTHSSLIKESIELLRLIFKQIDINLQCNKLRKMDLKVAKKLVDQIKTHFQIIIPLQTPTNPYILPFPKIHILSNQAYILTAPENSPKANQEDINQQYNENKTVMKAQEIAKSYLQYLEEKTQAMQKELALLEKEVQSNNLIHYKENQNNQNRNQLEKDKESDYSYDNDSIQDLIEFSDLNNKQKIALIDTYYKKTLNGTMKLGQNTIQPFEFVEFFRFENLRSFSQSMKIFKIYLMVQESKMTNIKTSIQPYIQDILILVIKNISISRNLLLKQGIDLIQMIYELKVLNNEVLKAILTSLKANQQHTVRNALEILLNLFVRNKIQTESQFHQILQQSSQLASQSASSQIKNLALQILIQAWHNIGDQINFYIVDLKYCQQRQFMKATRPIEDKLSDLNFKEKMKVCEIEQLIYLENIKNQEQLVQLIQYEIEFYHKRQSQDHSLNYLKIFQALLNSQNKIIVRNAYKLLSKTYQGFKPSEILSLFDQIMNIKESSGLVLSRIVLVQIMQYYGFSLFYHKIIEYLQQKKNCYKVIEILKVQINEISDCMLSELIELSLNIIEENQIILNNMVYEFLAMSCISRNDVYVENIIRNQYLFADEIIKKVYRQKEKYMYLIKLQNNNAEKQNSYTEQEDTSTDDDYLIHFDQDIDSFIYTRNEEEHKSNSDSSIILCTSDLDIQDNYSFITTNQEEQ